MNKKIVGLVMIMALGYQMNSFAVTNTNMKQAAVAFKKHLKGERKTKMRNLVGAVGAMTNAERAEAMRNFVAVPQQHQGMAVNELTATNRNHRNRAVQFKSIVTRRGVMLQK